MIIILPRTTKIKLPTFKNSLSLLERENRELQRKNERDTMVSHSNAPLFVSPGPKFITIFTFSLIRKKYLTF